MEPERYIERILETENLTDELEDSEAQVLLDWGLAELGPLLAKIKDPETAGGKVNQLMAVMRKINRIAGALESKSVDDLAFDLAALDELLRALHEGGSPSGSSPVQPATADECAQAAALLTTLDTHAALDFVFHWRTPSSSEPNLATGQE